MWLVKAVFEDAAKRNPDFIIWTGDTPPHDIWEGDATLQLNRIANITNLIASSFPKVPVYPSMGTELILC